MSCSCEALLRPGARAPAAARHAPHSGESP
jgi:hypothetical protein